MAIPSSGPISADSIRTHWGISGQFSLGSYRNLSVWDHKRNPDNGNRPYGITNLPSSLIKFSDFRQKYEIYPVDYCIIAGGGGGGGGDIHVAGGGGGGGRVRAGTFYMPNLDIDSEPVGWNIIHVTVGGGGKGGSKDISATGGNASKIVHYYTYPTSSGQLDDIVISNGGGAGAGNGWSSSGRGCGGGGSAYGLFNFTDDPGYGDETSGGSAAVLRTIPQGIIFGGKGYTYYLRSMAGGGGGAGGNGKDGIAESSSEFIVFNGVTYSDPTKGRVQAGQGGVPVELYNFLGSDSSIFNNAFDAGNRAGGGGGGGGWFQYDTTNSFRANEQLGGGGGGATSGEITQYVATPGKQSCGGGGGGGAQPKGGAAANGGSGAVILRYKNINNKQKGSGGTVYDLTINGTKYYTHIFYTTDVFEFYS